MSRTNLLGLVLALQLGLVFYVWNPSQQQGTGSGDQSLISIAAENITAIEITGKGEEDADELTDLEKPAASQTLKLVKVDGVWQMPEHDQFPIAPEKIEGVIGKLTDVKKGWPVGKTTIAAKTLGVTAENFEKKIVIKSQDDQKILYLGTSPGFKKVHAKLENEEFTWAVVMNSWDFSTESRDWRDLEILNVERPSVEKIDLTTQGVSVVKAQTGFEVSGLQEGFETNQQELNGVLKAALSPVFEELHSGGLDSSAISWLKWSVNMKDSENPAVYEIWDQGAEKDLVLKSSLHPWLFTVKRENFAAIKNASLEILSQKVVAELDDSAPQQDENKEELKVSDS